LIVDRTRARYRIHLIGYPRESHEPDSDLLHSEFPDTHLDKLHEQGQATLPVTRGAGRGSRYLRSASAARRLQETRGMRKPGQPHASRERLAAMSTLGRCWSALASTG
jgi:hypothetical protein